MFKDARRTELKKKKKEKDKKKEKSLKEEANKYLKIDKEKSSLCQTDP
jgi:hypothetical protein